MKILFIVGGLQSGGKERRIVELLKWLCRSADHQIVLVLLRRDIHYRDIFDYPVRIQYLEQKSLLKRIIELYKIYMIEKPDLIHTWDNISSLITIPTRILTGVHWINSQITTAPKHPLNYGWAVYLGAKLSFFFSDVIVANSLAGLASFRPPRKKSMHIYNGFDFRRIESLSDPQEIRKKFNLDKPKIVGMVASFSFVKDYATYLAAAEKVLGRRDDVLFLCVGNGDSTEYQNKLQEQNRSHVRFLGVQRDVESIMNVCNLGVLATFTEGISNAILEFMALGKPVIATEGGGTAELIVDGISGFLVPERDPDELAARILLIIGDEGCFHRMGRIAQNRVSVLFNLKQMAQQYVELYDLQCKH